MRDRLDPIAPTIGPDGRPSMTARRARLDGPGGRHRQRLRRARGGDPAPGQGVRRRPSWRCATSRAAGPMSTRTRASPSTPGRRSSPSRSSSTSWPSWRARRLDDYVTIVPCDPFYRIYFADGREFNYVGRPRPGSRPRSPGSTPTTWRATGAFLAYTEKVFDRAFTDLADHSFHSVWEMVKVAPDLIRLRAEQSVYKRVSTFIKDPRLRQVFSFEPLLIGGNPLRSSSIYSMIHYLEKTWGVHFAMGGTGALVSGLVRLFEDMGGRLDAGRAGRGDRGRRAARSGRSGWPRASGSRPTWSSPTATWPTPIGS